MDSSPDAYKHFFFINDFHLIFSVVQLKIAFCFTVIQFCYLQFDNNNSNLNLVKMVSSGSSINVSTSDTYNDLRYCCFAGRFLQVSWKYFHSSHRFSLSQAFLSLHLFPDELDDGEIRSLWIIPVCCWIPHAHKNPIGFLQLMAQGMFGNVN